jgi:hypothetical protein
MMQASRVTGFLASWVTLNSARLIYRDRIKQLRTTLRLASV